MKEKFRIREWLTMIKNPELRHSALEEFDKSPWHSGDGPLVESLNEAFSRGFNWNSRYMYWSGICADAGHGKIEVITNLRFDY